MQSLFEPSIYQLSAFDDSSMFKDKQLNYATLWHAGEIEIVDIGFSWFRPL